MKFALLSTIYILTYIVYAYCEEKEARILLGIEPSNRLATANNKPRYTKPLPSPRSARYDELTPEEREERVNRGFARAMQLATFLAHVDNYLTEKASGLIKLMGRAMESNDEEEDVENYNRISRHSPSRISKTMTT